MSFVVEKIPQQELARSDAGQIGFNPGLSTHWAIDGDRDAFIVLTKTEGGPYEGTQITKYYTLCWKNELIQIAADPLAKTFKEQGAVMSWRVHKLALPESLQNQKDAVLQLIRDAFGSIGEFFNGERFISVDVEFLGI